jgi:hypothetical protein
MAIRFPRLPPGALERGINSRPNPGFNYYANQPQPQPGQSKTVLHAPPVVPDDLETFSHTGVVPTTYVQLNFSEGNSIVTANVSILAKQANVSESFLEPANSWASRTSFSACCLPWAIGFTCKPCWAPLPFATAPPASTTRDATARRLSRASAAWASMWRSRRVAQVHLCARRRGARPDQRRLVQHHTGRVEQLRGPGRGQHLRGPCARGRGLQPTGAWVPWSGDISCAPSVKTTGRDLGP